MSLKTIAEQVKKGIREAGAIALEFPVITLGEELMKPTAGLYRNLLSMDVEENLRSYPIDGVVLLGNCDKTVPGLLMGALSANLPTIQLNAGPKKAGLYCGKRLGSGTDLWKYWDDLRTGKIDAQQWEDIGKALSCGYGSCNTMGTASTMNAMLEALGVMPLGLSTLPVDSEKRLQLSHEAGKRIVEMVMEDLRPAAFITRNSFRNAAALCMALGGSTNAIIHLTAIAGRLGINIYPDIFNETGKLVPCIVNVQPAGEKLIDEFDEAGGVPAVLTSLAHIIDFEATTYTGKKLHQLLENAHSRDQDIIRCIEDPVAPTPTIAILSGNLAPGGAVIKVAAASPHLLQHTGKAVVFENYEEMLARIDDETLEADESSVLVLKHGGPKAVPGMPEWGMIPIPKKLRAKGVRDMVRISDARMSGTAFGTVILHVTPEAAAGGPLALVKTGDIISIDIPAGTISLNISEEEMIARKNKWTAPPTPHKRGYPALYIREVLQADEGCDLAFLKPGAQEDLHFIEPVVGRS